MGKALTRVGFFRELHSEPGLPSIREFVRSSPHPDESRIVAYLDAGKCLAGCGGAQFDVLDPFSKRVTSPDMVTDGVWLWPGELDYYVGVHHVELPAAFVTHMRMNGWAVPPLSDSESVALWDQIVRGWRERVRHAEPGAAADGGGM